MQRLLLVYVIVSWLFGVIASSDCDYQPLKGIYCMVQVEQGHVQLCAKTVKTVPVHHRASLYIYTRYRPAGNETPCQDAITLRIVVKSSGIAKPDNNAFTIGLDNHTTLYFDTVGAGRSLIIFKDNGSNHTNDSSCFPVTIQRLSYTVREISVVHWQPLDIIILVVGWLYFAAWSISFYPQIFLNCYRRSVEGLNFDYLLLNITGFLAYSAFNIGLYWIPSVLNEYYDKHPGGVNPVQLNDVIFALHAAAASLFTIFQCLIFDRAGQRVSIVGCIIISVLWLVMVVSLFVSVGGALPWLQFLYIVSYVKLAVTLIKYVPQAFMNFRRKSTVGWSIGNVLLDFTGGVLSILQMILISYNYDDWKSIFGDPTKFGLGAFSICFDLLFMFQHYILYRNPKVTHKNGYTKIDESEYSITSEKAPLLSDINTSLPIRTKLKMNAMRVLIRMKVMSPRDVII